MSDDDVIRYQYGSNRPQWWSRIFIWVCGFSLLVMILQAVFQHRVSVAALFWLGVALLGWVLPRLMPSGVVADQSGIRARPYINVKWDDVDYVIEPNEYYDQVVRIRLKNGQQKITGFAPRYAPDLARIGRKDLKPER